MASLPVVDQGSRVACVASEAPTSSGHCSLGGFLTPHLCVAQDVGHEDEFFGGDGPKDSVVASVQVIASHQLDTHTNIKNGV
jgi:hypothetical protein